MELDNKSFEDIKHIDENNIEFWYARELMPVLQYSNWQNFKKIINKAKKACENSDISVSEHFTDVSKLSKRANDAEVEINDYKLSRYACYLIAQNGDSRKIENYTIVLKRLAHYNILFFYYFLDSKYRKTQFSSTN